MAGEILAFIGGTGPEGLGLAARFAAAGHEIAIGSRSPERAQQAVEKIRARVPQARIAGMVNQEAVRRGDIVFVTIPFAAHRDTLEALAPAIGSRKVIDVVAPISFEKGRARLVGVPEGSVAEQAQRVLPQAHIAAGFHHLDAAELLKLDVSMEGDVIVCGDHAEAKAAALGLAETIPDIRGVDGGGLVNARYLEQFTVLLLNLNRIHKAHTALHIEGLMEQVRDLKWAMTSMRNLMLPVERGECSDIVRETASLAKAVVQSEASSVMLYELETGRLRLAWHSDPAVAAPSFLVEVSSDDLLGAAFGKGLPVILDGEDLFRPIPGERALRNVLAVPMRSPAGPVGVLTVVNRLPFGARYSAAEAETLQSLADVAGLILMNARLTSTLQYLADHDGMTGLLRRDRLPAAVEALVADASVKGDHVVFLILDLDWFKGVNDLLGYQRGDRLIKAVARGIEALAEREGLLACHWGGDGFAVVGLLETADEGEALADRLRESVQAVLDTESDLRGAGLPLTLSVGVCTQPRQAARYDELVDAAYKRLKREKEDKFRRDLLR